MTPYPDLCAPKIQLRDGTVLTSPLPEPLERAITEEDLVAASSWYQNLEVHAHAGHLEHPQRTLAVASAYVTKVQLCFGPPDPVEDLLFERLEKLKNSIETWEKGLDKLDTLLQALVDRNNVPGGTGL